MGGSRKLRVTLRVTEGSVVNFSHRRTHCATTDVEGARERKKDGACSVKRDQLWRATVQYNGIPPLMGGNTKLRVTQGSVVISHRRTNWAVARLTSLFGMGSGGSGLV